MQYLLAHDLGTSGDKATLFGIDGRMRKSVAEHYPCRYSGPCAEQNPEDWYAAVCRATQRLLAEISPAEVLGVSFSGHMMGAVLLDRAGGLLCPAMIWADRRAGKQCAEISRAVGDARFYAITGNRNNPSNSLPKLLWALEEGLRPAALLNCKDYIACRLTGELGTDYSDASGTGAFDLSRFQWSEEILRETGVPLSVFPPLQGSAACAGKISARAAAETGLLAGTPCYRGCGDGTAAALGSGISEPGEGYCSLGSSAWISFLSDRMLMDAEQRSFHLAGAEKGKIYPLGTMQAAGLSYNWMRDTIARETGYAEINRAAAEAAPGANGVLFLPYLLGERSPWWDDAARGAFLGLRKETTNGELLRAVMEGVTMNLALILKVLRQQAPLPSLRVMGGCASDPFWRQLLADILNCRIEKLENLEEACSMGAAMAAGVGAGAFRDFSAARRLVKTDGAAEPDPERTSFYAERLAVFEDACRRLQGLRLQ